MQNKTITIKQKLLQELEYHFGSDAKRISHARKVMGYAEELLKREKADWYIVVPASILHDVGIKAAEEKYGSAAGHYQETEGPPIARAILLKVGFKKEDIDEICQIIAHHHSPGKINTQNFKVLYDADWLVNFKDEVVVKDKEKLSAMFDKIFLTETGKKIAGRIYFKKQGPSEWTVAITKLPPRGDLIPGQPEKREKLKEALRRLHEAGPEELEKVKKDVEVYFKETDPKELALAEQELIQEGTRRQEMRRLCDVHLEVMKEQLGVKSKKIKLPASHPISILKDEHKIIKRNLKKLKKTFEKVKTLGAFDEAARQMNTLKELSHFFVETEKHHKREEEGLFPRLEAHGIIEPPQIFKEDHVGFLAKKKEFYNAMMAEQKNFEKFVGAVGPIVEYLAKDLEEHIYKEDNILYPMSLETLEKDEWKMVRKKFDAIGYCCFTPADFKKRGS